MADRPRPELTDDEKEAFDNPDSDRAKAITLGAIVENRLTSLLRLSLRQDEQIANELFRSSGALGSFATKIRMAYMGGLIPKNLYDDLFVVNRVRNQFAHDLGTKSFDARQIAAWIRNMHVYSALTAPRDEKVPPGDEMFYAADRIVMEETLRTMQGAYRECLRLIIRRLMADEKSLVDWRQHRAQQAKDGS